MDTTTMTDLVEINCLSTNGSNCDKCNHTKRSLDYKNLNDYQKKAYNEIQKLFNSGSGKVVTIDTDSGTGKTFLLSTLASNEDMVKFITFRKDQASELKCTNIDVYTYISFNMRYFNLSYREAIRMFTMPSDNNVQELYKLIVYSKKFVSEGMNTIILDIYTIPPPTMLILLYILSIKHNNLRLIFSGNSMQLSAIGKSAFHNESNFHIVQMLTDLTINRLTKNMRTCDTILEEKVSRFRKIIRDFKSTGDIQFYFNLRYALYCLFRPQHFTEERFDTVYIAQTHKNITSRLNRFVKHLQKIGRPYFEVPFYYQDKSGYSVPLSTIRKGKFFPFLLLVEGYRYIYINDKGVHHVVLLEKLLFSDNYLVAVTVRFINDDHHEERLEQCKLNYYQILPAYREWLLKNVKHVNDEIWQFPLRPYALTYHATLGRTIEKANVELSTDCTYGNFVYIGLCSVRHHFDIHKIHNERDLLGYVVTDYMENERNDSKYYYRCPMPNANSYQILEYVSNKGVNKFIENIQWIDVDSIDQFECKQSSEYLRIDRGAYKKLGKKIDTPLMQIARFVKERPDVILNTMNTAPANNLSTGKNNNNNNNNNNKKKKKQQDQKSDAYEYLQNEYAQWAAENKK